MTETQDAHVDDGIAEQALASLPKAEPVSVKVADGDAFVLLSVQAEDVEPEISAEDGQGEARNKRLSRAFDRMVKGADALGNAMKALRDRTDNPVLRAPLDLLIYSTGNATRLGGFAYMGYDISQGIAGRLAPSLDKDNPNNLKDFASVFGVASSGVFMLADSYESRSVDVILDELEQNLSRVGMAGLSSVAEQRRAEMPAQEKVQKLASDRAGMFGGLLQVISSGFMFLYGAREKKAGERAGAILNILGFGAKLFEEAETMPEREWYDPRRVIDFIRYRPSVITGFTGNAASVGSITAGLEDLARGVKKGEGDDRFTDEERAQYRKAGFVQGVGQIFNSVGDFAMGSAKKDFEGLNDNADFFQRAAETMVRHIETAQGANIDEKLRFAAKQVAEQLSFEMSLAPNKIENKLLKLVQVDKSEGMAR